MHRLIRVFASPLTIPWSEHYLEFLSLKGGWHILVWVYTCQNTTLLEITCSGSYHTDVTLKLRSRFSNLNELLISLSHKSLSCCNIPASQVTELLLYPCHIIVAEVLQYPCLKSHQSLVIYMPHKSLSSSYISAS